MVDMEKCTKNVGGGRYDLVIIASRRLREIRNENRNSENPKYTTAIDALLEIQNNCLDLKKYLEK
jgi:DNA-directed RNA polymerase subunit K/omega